MEKRIKFFIIILFILLLSVSAFFAQALECISANDVFASPQTNLNQIDLNGLFLVKQSSTSPLSVTDCNGDGALDIYIPHSSNPPETPVEIEVLPGICGNYFLSRIDITVTSYTGNACTFYAYNCSEFPIASFQAGGSTPQTLTLQGNPPERICKITVTGEEICIIDICWECFVIEPDLAGTIMHSNAPVSNITSSEPAFWFRDESTKQGIFGVSTTYDTSTGAFAFFGLPNTLVLINISYHLTGSWETLPGNYYNWVFVDLPVLTPGEKLSYNLYVDEIIHLLEPYDNNQITLTTGTPYPEHSSPITFSWDPITGTDYYSLLITEYNDSPYSLIQDVVSINLSETSYTTVLPNSASATHYEFKVDAYNSNDIPIGHYMTTYANGGFGGDYRFIITEPDPTPDPTPGCPSNICNPSCPPIPGRGCPSSTRVCGDVNSSGNVDIVDSLIIAQYYVCLCPSEMCDLWAADVNCDCYIDIVDALMIAQYYVGLPVTLNCCRSSTTPPPTPAPTRVSFNMIQIPAGSYYVGGNPPGNDNVTLVRNYDIAESEVTYELWNDVHTRTTEYTCGNAGNMERIRNIG